MSKKRKEKKLVARIKKQAGKRGKPAEISKDFLSPAQLLPGVGGSSSVDLKAPEGFRPITATQALIMFAEPFQKYLQSGEIDDMNVAMNLSMQIWNYTLPKAGHKLPKQDIIEEMAAALKIDELDAVNLFEEMVERKAYLFPPEIQPADVRTLFMRKEVDYQIEQFDETQLAMSATPIPANQDDQAMLADLQRLDQAMADDEEYDEWEDLYFQLEKDCSARYFEWLTAKGVLEQYTRIFPFCVEMFFNFVYRYNAIEIVQISEFDLEEFFLDHLPRKVLVQPNEYTCWPPALRLFYRFLAEKGYLHDPRPLTSLFDAIEPDFVDMLQKQF